LIDHKSTLHEKFKGKWPLVIHRVNWVLALEVFWWELETACGFHKLDITSSGQPEVVNLSDWEFFSENNDKPVEMIKGFKLKDTLKDVFPKNRFELRFFNWEQELAKLGVYTFVPIADDGPDDDVLRPDVISSYLLKDHVLKTTSSGKIDTSDMTAATNSMWHKFVRKVCSFLFDPIPSSTARSGRGDVAVETDSRDQFKPDDHGFISYQRFFPEQYQVEIPSNGDSEDADGESNQDAKFQYRRNVDSGKLGSKVKVLLLKKSVFELSSLWFETFPTDSEGYSKRLTLSFADPPWGLNTDAGKYGGIDLVEERWGRYESTQFFLL
jgi:hypothetical protein